MSVLLLLAAAAWADPTAAEVNRLEQELDKLAQKNAWEGVERKYLSLLSLTDRHEVDVHLLGAQAARSRGEIAAVAERLDAALAAGADAEAAAWRQALTAEYGAVDLRCDPCTPLEADPKPFAGDKVRAIDYASSRLLETGRFRGLLPTTSYTLSGTAFRVEAGADPLELDAGDSGRSDVMALGRVPRKRSVDGKGTKLSGAGLHSASDDLAYIAALYVRKPSGDGEAAIDSTAPKRVALHLQTDATRDQLVAHIGRTLNAYDVGGAFRPRITQLTLMLEDAGAGQTLAFDWEPSRRGVAVYLDKRELGVVKGTDFMGMLWRVFVGHPPMSRELKAALLER